MITLDLFESKPNKKLNSAAEDQGLAEGFFGDMLDKINFDSGEANAAASDKDKEFRARWAELAPKAKAGDPKAQQELERLRKEIHFWKTGEYEGGVAEGHADQQRRILKKNGKPVGEVGIDRESSPGVGQWYMKCYVNGIDNSGYDSMEEAVAELKHCLKQGVAEGSDVTDYNPKSQGGTRKELLAKYHKTKNPKDAEAARKAGATQKELQGVAEAFMGYDIRRVPNLKISYEDSQELKRLISVITQRLASMPHSDPAVDNNWRALVTAKNDILGILQKNGLKESDIKLPYAPGSENLGRANMELLIKAYNNPTSPRLTLHFGDQSIDLDTQDIDAIADYYDDQLPSNADRWDFVRKVMSSYDNFVTVLGKLGRRKADLQQPGLFQEANKKKDDDDLGQDIKDVALQRAISRAKADFPTAGSGLEALAKDFMRSQDQDQKAIDQIRQAKRQQDQMLATINKLDQEQEQEIQDLEKQNSGLAQRLQQLQNVNSELEKKIAAMSGRKERRKTDQVAAAPSDLPKSQAVQPAASQTTDEPTEPTTPASSAQSANVFRHVAKDLTTEPETPPSFAGNVRDIKQAKKYADKTSAIAQQVAANPDQAANAMTMTRAAESKRTKTKSEPPEVDYDDEFDAMVSRVGKLAKEGPRKTVWDPVKRVYKTVPVNPQNKNDTK